VVVGRFQDEICEIREENTKDEENPTIKISVSEARLKNLSLMTTYDSSGFLVLF